MKILYSPFIDSIEGQKIYSFDYFFNNKQKGQLEPTELSSITEIYEKSALLNNITIDSEIFESFDGKINSFNLSENKIMIFDNNRNKNYILFLNNNLMKKIHLDCNCLFLSIRKVNDTYYKYTNFSNIIPKEQTFIRFKVTHKI